MKKVYDIIVVGELNVDLILDQIEKFPEVGKEVLAHKMTLTLGSSSAIFASNISSLGSRVAFIGKIGKDKFGEVVLESLQRNKVDTSMIKIDNTAGTGATINLNMGEDRANTTYPGAMDLLTIDDISEDDLKKARHLHFSSFFLQPGIRGDIGKLFSMAKNAGLTTSFDMQWDPEEKWELDLHKILPYVDVFLPNEAELMLLTRQSNLAKAIEIVKIYKGIIVIKRSNKGSMVWYKDALTDLPAFLNENVVDAIGAGDSFNAGFIHQFINGADINICQKFGNLTGAVSTTASGGTAAFEDHILFKQTALDKFGVEI